MAVSLAELPARSSAASADLRSNRLRTPLGQARRSGILGTQQSPVNIREESTFYVPVLKNALELDYLTADSDKTTGKFAKEKFSIEDPENWGMQFQSEEYQLINIHFHACCEHKLNCCNPARHELHVVHRKVDSTDILVLAIFFDSDPKAKSRDFFKKMAAAAKKQRSQKKDKSSTEVDDNEKVSVKLKDFMQVDFSRWFLYQGSLTSYPYSQDVTWIVNLDIDTINSKDLKDISVIQQHVRDPQPLHRRYVLRNFD